MEKIKLNISLPFSWWQKNTAEGQALFKPTRNMVPLYLEALKRELLSLGEDLQEYQVDAIHFDGGYMSLFMPDDFNALMATIHRAFRLTDSPEVSGTLFPGSLDMALLSTYRNIHAGPLMFEVPSLMMRECEQQHLPNVLQLLDHGNYLLQSYQEKNWGISLPEDIPGRDKGKWEHIARMLIHYQPAHIHLFRLAEGDCAGEEMMLPQLEKVGYRSIKRGFMTRASQTPRYIQAQYAGFAGVGLNAVTELDGYRTQNTSDMNYYLRRSGDYRDLLVRVEQCVEE